jgi:hypothetical protein
MVLHQGAETIGKSLGAGITILNRQVDARIVVRCVKIA